MTNIVVGLIGLAIGVALGWLIAQLRTSQRIAEATSAARVATCLLYTSPSPRDVEESRMPSSA